MKLGSIEKDKQPSQEILRLFEKTRVAYLSAAQDPDEYGGRWRNAVDTIIESYEELDAAGKELKNFIDEKFEVKWEHAPVRPGDARHTQANIDRIMKLGWKPKVKITDGLGRCFK